MEETLDERSLVAGRYRLGETIGTGGMSVVYEAFDERLQRPVAVKMLREELAERPDVRSRFETEARWAARLSHPHAVAVYDTGEHGGVPFLVMERLPGETLADRIRRGPVDPEWLRGIAVEVLGALGAAHECGIVHRDVKPGNILLTAAGHAKIADFGIAKSLGMDGDREDLTRTGQLIGTPSYLAPERLDGSPATAQADIYSLGVVLYEALAGRKPFDGTNALAVAYAIAHEEPVPLRELRPDAPDDLVSVVETAMRRDPARRWQRASDMAEALGATRPLAVGATQVIGPAAPVDPAGTVVAERPATQVLPGNPAGTVVGDTPAPAAPARRRPRLGWAAVALGVLAVLAIGLLLSGGGGDSGLPGTGRDGDPALAAQMREVADRVEVGDGPKGGEAADRLRAIASKVEAGEPAGDEATALLRDAQAWNADRQLYDTATKLVTGVLVQVPGVDTSATSAATAPPPTAAPVASAGGDRTPKAGKPGKGKGREKD